MTLSLKLTAFVSRGITGLRLEGLWENLVDGVSVQFVKFYLLLTKHRNYAKERKS